MVGWRLRLAGLRCRLFRDVVVHVAVACALPTVPGRVVCVVVVLVRRVLSLVVWRLDERVVLTWVWVVRFTGVVLWLSVVSMLVVSLVSMTLRLGRNSALTLL